MAQRETILPRTVVPDYLDGTPLARQTRHADNFDLSRAPLSQAGSTTAFARPNMAANIALIESNLGRLAGYYFEMPWRKPETP
jgi:hypothetical protein